MRTGWEASIKWRVRHLSFIEAPEYLRNVVSPNQKSRNDSRCNWPPTLMALMGGPSKVYNLHKLSELMTIARVDIVHAAEGSD